MCGIVGEVSLKLSNKISADSLENVRKGVEEVGHRGPDYSSIVSSDGYVFGHCRLSIIGENERGQQPAVSDDGAVLVFNGEIYNYKALARKHSLGRPDEIVSDTEVLFSLLRLFGESIVAELDGMFAFVFRDRLGQLLLARDRFGIKPLYYIIDKEVLFFSSELRGFNRKKILPNFSSVGSYLINGCYPATGNETFFENVFQVEAGHCLSFSPSAYNKGKSKVCFSPREVVGSLGVIEVLNQIDEKISVSDVPICFSLSGGVDSTLALASFVSGMEADGRNTNAIMCRPFSSEYSEEVAAVSTARHLGVQLHVCSPPTIDSDEIALEHLLRLTNIIEAPVRSPGLFMQEAVYQRADQLGFKVIVDGEGADDLMGAYYGSIFATLIDVFQERGWKYGLVEARSVANKCGINFYKLMAKCALEYSRQLSFVEQKKQIISFRNREIDTLVKRSSLPTLLHWGDRLSMNCGVEARPFYLFQDFLDWSKDLSASDALLGGYNKWPLRSVLSSHYGFSEVAFDTRKRGYSTIGSVFSGIAKIPETDPVWRDFENDVFGRVAKIGGKSPGGDFRSMGTYFFLKNYGGL